MRGNVCRVPVKRKGEVVYCVFFVSLLSISSKNRCIETPSVLTWRGCAPSARMQVFHVGCHHRNVFCPSLPLENASDLFRELPFLLKCRTNTNKRLGEGRVGVAAVRVTIVVCGIYGVRLPWGIFPSTVHPR